MSWTAEGRPLSPLDLTDVWVDRAEALIRYLEVEVTTSGGAKRVLLPMPFAFVHLRSGELVRLLPGWYSDAGPLSLYYPSRKMLPAKTRVFVDFVVERFRSAGFARLVDAR